MNPTGGKEGIIWLSPVLGRGVQMGRAGAQIVVDWRGIGGLSSLSGGEGTFMPVPGADVALLEKFCATSLLACRRYLAGALSLHGSAVALPTGAIVFVSDCDAGKSTTGMASRGTGALFWPTSCLSTGKLKPAGSSCERLVLAHAGCIRLVQPGDSRCCQTRAPSAGARGDRWVGPHRVHLCSTTPPNAPASGR